MHVCMMLFILSAKPPQAPLPPHAPPIEVRLYVAEQDIISLRNDVEALKRDVSAKCDVASKSTDPKPATKCPDGVCADCKCTVGSDCGCRKLAGAELVAAASQPVTYREVRTCNGGTCTVQMVPVDATDETPQVMLQPRNGNSSPCSGGSCGVGAAGRVVRGFRLFRRR